MAPVRHSATGQTVKEIWTRRSPVPSGKGWTMIRPDSTGSSSKVVGLAEAVERYGRKRSHGADNMMEGVEPTTERETHTPPRKKARATHLPPITTFECSRTSITTIWPSAPPSGASSPQPQAPLQPDLALTTLLTLPSLLSHFTSLPQPLQSHFLLTYYGILPYPVSKAWRAIIDSDPVLWSDLLKSTKIWFGGVTERAFAHSIYARRRLNIPPTPQTLPLSHPYKMLFKSDNSLELDGWITRTETSILPRTRLLCELLQMLDGHEGGVWALAACKDTLVSGSTDRTVRIWNLATGRCTHIFGGHTSTVRCLAIVKPEWIEIEGEGGVITKEKWPKRSVIVTGSRDHSLRVWTLPRPGDPEYRCYGADDSEADPADEDADDNPYHKMHLEGHDHAVRALAARGRTLVSGSYDCTVRIWDIVTGECKWVLVGHTQKVYSVVLDIHRQIACSGSMDGTVRQCQHTLTGPHIAQLRHTLAAHTGAITCFQHDEFKVLSGSDGTLKMWNVRDGTVVRDLLTGIQGVWQVVFEGRWCVAASNRNPATDEWIGEPPSGFYDDDTEEEDEVEEIEQADVDAMDQDPRTSRRHQASKWAPPSKPSGHQRNRPVLGEPSGRAISHPADGIPSRLPPINETPTRPRIRQKQRR
ncbi:WD40-repeat-containing domain protein [Suillus subalutaceus]|uniref:WD40-repeat-containing domain protein n=1 Tax=Suillus subalutaceus TaxID=48586 RepID=UPI001B87EDA8|nr:WD40-repeat-containing domain protein [Suillus subalutaceus]KAG1863640.1 WD40-repeat-containing domain protein [Suillus subalutaceus]